MRRTHGDMFGGGGDMFREMDNMMNNMMRGFGPNMVIFNCFFVDRVVLLHNR